MEFIAANGFEEFINGNGIWIIIGCLGLAFIVSIVFLFLNIIRARKIMKTEAEETKTDTEETKTDAITSVENDAIFEESKSEKKQSTTSLFSVYSITQDEKTKEWVVKKEGAKRATRRCKTKAEAEEVVENLTNK